MMCRRCEKNKPDIAFPAKYVNHAGTTTTPRICKVCRAFGPQKEAKISREQSRIAVELDKLGVPVAEIAKELGVARQALEYHLSAMRRAAPIALEDQSAIWLAKPIQSRSARDVYDRSHDLTSGNRNLYRADGIVYSMQTRSQKPGSPRAGNVA